MAIAVAGVAGSGKSTLGRALAASLALPLLDLDSLTNPLLDTFAESVLGGHWLASPHGRAIRDGRYAALRSTAHDVVRSAGGVVLVAPFTAELSGGPEWQSLRDAVAPAGLQVLHLVGDDQMFARRRAARAEVRDAHRPADPPATERAGVHVPVLTIDASLTPAQQLHAARHGLGLRDSGAQREVRRSR